MALRYYSSVAQPTTLSASVSAGATSMSIAAATGLPSSYPYTMILEQDTVNEEIVEVTNRSGTTLTVTRGVDGTTGVAHQSSATIAHGFSARDLSEPNAHVNASSGVHGLSGSVVGTSDSQTLTNKVIAGGSNTLSGIAQSSVTGLTTDLAAKIPASIVDAKGDLIAGTAADTVARVAVGANGLVLTAASGEAAGVKWASAGAPSGTASPSAVSSFSIDSCFTSAARMYRVEGWLTSASGAPIVNIRLRAASTDASTGYAFSIVIDNPFTPSSALSTSQTELAVAKASTEGCWFSIDLFNPAHAVATGVKSHYVSGAASPVQGWYGGAHATATAYDGITFLAAGGVNVTGEIRVYPLPLA